MRIVIWIIKQDFVVVYSSAQIKSSRS